MSKKLKNLILFGIFILILFASTLTKQFSSDILWNSEQNTPAQFQGLLFKDPTEISNLKISRSLLTESNEDLIKYDIEFTHSGEESSFRILGTPVRQVFFGEDVYLKHSSTNLNGDYDKVNNKLFSEKLSLKDTHKKLKDYEFKAKSEIRVPLKSEEDTYSFSVIYKPRELFYKNKVLLSKTSVFLTNAKVDKFTNEKKINDGEEQTFSESGFYVNTQEINTKSVLSKISLTNTLCAIIFLLSTLVILLSIWLDKSSIKKLMVIPLMLMVVTFYRFVGYGSTTFGVLVVMTLLAYIASVISKLMVKDNLIISKKELKQSLAYAIGFFVVVLIVLIIPRTL